MAALKRDATKQAKAKQRQRLPAKARHERQQRQAQRDLHAWHPALHALGLPNNLVVEIAGRLRAQTKLLGQLCGLMCPTLLGCRSADELTRGRGWDKPAPSRLLGALPKRSGLKRLGKRGQDLLSPLWGHVESMSAATRSRWPWTWGWDDSVCRQYGQAFARVGTWYRGQHKRGVRGLDGVLRIVVIGDGTLIVPVDFAGRRPDPQGPGARCRNPLVGAQVLVDQSLPALARRGVHLPTPMAVADRWFRDSKGMRHVRDTPQGLWLVQGKSTSTVRRPDGRKVKGADWVQGETWPWRPSLEAPACRDARLRARSATDGEGPLSLVDKRGEDRFSLRCLATAMPATRVLRVWSRRNRRAQVLRTLKHLLATDACQVRSEDAYDGHLVLRLIASSVLYYTSRVIFRRRVTMDEMICNLRHHWSSVDCQELDVFGLS
jgi:hypothetical protein